MSSELARSKESSTPSEKSVSRLNHATAWLSVLSGLLTVVVGGLGVFAYHSSQDKVEARQAAGQLKEQNDDLQKQIDSTKARIASLNTQLDAARKALDDQPTDPPSIDSSAQSVALADPTADLVSASNGINRTANLKINGKSFTYGFTGCWIGCGKATADLDLGRDYKTFTATLGVTDDSRADGTARVQIIGDGKILSTRSVRLGVSYKVRLPVSNVLRLEITESNDGGVRVAIGDPTAAP